MNNKAASSIVERKVSYFNMNESLDLLNCPNLTLHDLKVIGDITFWVEGVAVCCIGIPGVILNLAAICILSARVSRKNNFNEMLITLFVFESSKTTVEDVFAVTKILSLNATSNLLNLKMLE